MTDPIPAVVVGVNVPPDPPEEEPEPDPQGPLLQQTFHDTREIEAAEQAGLATPQGAPLQPSQKLALREASKAMKNGIAWMEHALRKIEEAHR